MCPYLEITFMQGAHAHINLLGWLSIAALGLIHSFYPTADQTWIGKAALLAPSFWAAHYNWTDAFTGW